MSMQRFIFILPATLFLLLVGCLGYRLNLIGKGNAPDTIPSVMINRPVPTFNLPALYENKPGFASADLKDKITFVDFFASWCEGCRVEHPYLGEAKKLGVRLVGIDYKDKPEEAKKWLEKMGDPYDAIGLDKDGRTAIDFGLYGVPESYLIDKQGIIRFKQTGPLTPEIIQTKILPLVKELNQ